MIFRLVRDHIWLARCTLNKRKYTKLGLWRHLMKYFYRHTVNACARLRVLSLSRFMPQSKSSIVAISATPFLPFGTVHAETLNEHENPARDRLPVEDYISVGEMRDCVKSFKEVKSSVNEIEQGVIEAKEKSKKKSDEWELIMDKKGMKVWRKPVPNSSLCYYRCFAKVEDTAPSAYFKVQFEDQMRKQMDKGIKVLTSEPVQLHPEQKQTPATFSGEHTSNVMSKGFDEVLWVHAFPFPLKSRVYRYYRRGAFIPEDNAFVLVSKSIDNWDPKSDPRCPQDAVPVHTYHSTIVISALEGKSTTDLGFEYVLCYVDDPQVVLPNRFLTIATTDGIPKLMDQCTTAAKVLFSSNKQSCFDAHEEYSIDPEVRKAFEKRKENEQNNNTGNDFGVSGFKWSKKVTNFGQNKSSDNTNRSENTNFMPKNISINNDSFNPSFDKILTKTVDIVKEKTEVAPKKFEDLKYKRLTPLAKRVNQFVGKNEFVFNRISDKGNFMFEN